MRLFGIKWGCLATECRETFEKKLKKLILSVISVAYPTKYQRTQNDK
jgi:hypothetical protein